MVFSSLNVISVIFSGAAQDLRPTLVDGNGAETGHVIVTTVAGSNGQSKQVLYYTNKIEWHKVIFNCRLNLCCKSILLVKGMTQECF